MTFKRVIDTKDYLGNDSRFGIIWEKVFLSCTFSVGIDFNDPNELSIFYVYNVYGKDHYECLDTLFLDVYKKYGHDITEKVKKEIANKAKLVLASRVQAGLLTVETIEKWAEHGWY